MLREVTCHQATVTSLEYAYDQIDVAIAAALTQSKPVLIQVRPSICDPQRVNF